MSCSEKKMRKMDSEGMNDERFIFGKNLACAKTYKEETENHFGGQK